MLSGNHEYWSESGAEDGGSVNGVTPAIAFYGYNYPNAHSANTGDYRANAVILYVVTDELGESYIVAVIDRPNDGSGGKMKMNLEVTSIPTAIALSSAQQPNVEFMDDHSGSRSSADTETASCSSSDKKCTAALSWQWAADETDGMVYGPLKACDDWKVRVDIPNADRENVEKVYIGSYDSTTHRTGFPIQFSALKADLSFGGFLLEQMGCTDYCQTQYSTCGECVKDDHCQFAPNNGGCVSATAFVPDSSCPKPKNSAAKITVDGRLQANGMQSLKIRSPDRLRYECPCEYHHYVVIYDMAHKEVSYNAKIPITAGHRFAYGDVAGLSVGTNYMAWVYTCSQDECSEPLIDEIWTLSTAAA